MKHTITIVAGAALLMLAAGCSKQKTCRCAVLGTDKVRVIKIDKGECDHLNVFQYHDGLNNIIVDSLLCTDHEFAIDSIYND